MTMNQTQPAFKTMSKKTSVPNKLDPIAVLREELEAAALCHGLEHVDDFAETLVQRVVQRLGGSHVYVPNAKALVRERITFEIRKKFYGRNVREFAKEYGYSVRQVQRLVLSSS